MKGMFGGKKADESVRRCRAGLCWGSMMMTQNVVPQHAHHADDRAAYMLIKGSMLKAVEKHDEAMQCFREVIAIKAVIKEKFYLPYCLVCCWSLSFSRAADVVCLFLFVVSSRLARSTSSARVCTRRTSSRRRRRR